MTARRSDRLGSLPYTGDAFTSAARAIDIRSRILLVDSGRQRERAEDAMLRQETWRQLLRVHVGLQAPPARIHEIAEALDQAVMGGSLADFDERSDALRIAGWTSWLRDQFLVVNSES